MERFTIEPGDAAGLDAAASNAARVIERGGAVLVPTETKAALAVGAGHALRVWEIKGHGAEPLAVHLSSRDAMARVFDAWPGCSALHRRVIARFVPGAVQVHVPMSEEELEAAVEMLGVPRGVSDTSDELLLRAPSHPLARRVLDACGGPAVMASASVRDMTEPKTVDQAAARFEQLDPDRRPALVLDMPPEPAGRGSTAVRLVRDGSIEVIREGMIEERFLRSRLAMVVVFVCTGNTCRSPMAAAIARTMVVDRGAGDVPVEIRSAGATALDGAPATPEAVDAAAAMGADLSSHRSTPLSRGLLEDADAVFAMTAAHAETALAINPGVADRVKVLDPGGGDVQDPIGQPARVYRDTAERLREMIVRRFEELGVMGARTA